MATIVIEGPEESGKTTLAQAIQQAMPGSAVIHSPVKALKAQGSVWSHEWNRWITQHNPDDGLVILDRTPEVSESVYGVHRTHTRGGSLILRLNEIADSGKWVCFIFCEAPLEMTTGHVDAAGETVYHDRFLDHKILYQFLYRDLNKMAIEHRVEHNIYPSPFQVIRYNRFDPVGIDSADAVWWQIRNFLQGAFPERHNQIGEYFGIGMKVGT